MIAAFDIPTRRAISVVMGSLDEPTFSTESTHSLEHLNQYERDVCVPWFQKVKFSLNNRRSLDRTLIGGE